MKMQRMMAMALFLPGLATAAPYAYPFNMMSGADVVQKLTHEPVSHLDYIERDIAHGYVNGLKDGTQGQAWCFTGKILPHELNIELAHALKETRSATDLRGNAGPLVVAELRKRYPCQRGKP